MKRALIVVVVAFTAGCRDGRTGPEGGTIEIGPSSRLVVPEGALTAPSPIAARTLADGRVELLPHGQRFAKPVRLTLSSDGVDLDRAAVVSQSADGSVDIHPIVARDDAARTVTVETTHFTQFWVQPLGLWYRTRLQPRTLAVQVKVVTLFGEKFMVSDGASTGSWETVGKGSVASFWTSSSNLLFIHGFSSDARSFTGPANLLEGLSPSYENVVTYQYRSAYSVADNAVWLRDRILENASAGFKTDIVAHSMGGLVARWMIEALGGVDDKIGKLVTIATPHQGTPWALLAQAYDDIPDLPDSASEYFPGLLDLLPTPAGAGPLLNASYTDNAVDYFLVAGVRVDAPLLGPGDGVVLVASALGLPSLGPPEAATVFPAAGPPGADWSHRNLLRKAADNGVLAQVLAWLTP